MRLSGMLAAVALVLAGLAAAPPAQAAIPEVSALLYDPSGDAAGADLRGGRVHVDPNVGRVDGTVYLEAAPSVAAEARVKLGTETGGTCYAATTLSVPIGAGGAPATYGSFGQAFDTTDPARAGTAYDCVWIELWSGGALVDDMDEYDDFSTVGKPYLHVAGDTTRLTKKRWGRLPITVSNTGDSTSYNTVLTLSAPKRLKVDTGTVAIGALGPDQSRTVTVRVKLAQAGRKNLTASLTGDLAESDTDTIAVEVAPKLPPRTGSLAGTYLWGIDSANLFEGWDNHALFFLDRTWAFRGFPTGGVPKRCTKRIEGCVPYAWDRKRKVLQVDADRGTYQARKNTVKLGSETYVYPLAPARRGTRYAWSLHFDDFSGNCILSCVTWSGYFEVRRDGTYELNGEAGTYRVLSRGRVRLSPYGGTPRISTLLIGLDDRGRPAPGEEQVFLDDRNYYSSDD